MALDILGTERTIDFNIFPELASQLFATPMAAISLIDNDRQWFKASVGLDVAETPRAMSFCAHAILNPSEVLYVPDAMKDERFADSELVSGDLGTRFYAGVPIIGPTGYPVGALCIVDREPRIMGESELGQLRKLAIGVETALKRHMFQREVRNQESRHLLTRAMLASVFKAVDCAVAIMRSKGSILLANPQFIKLLGYSVDELTQKTLRDLCSPECHPDLAAAHARQSATGDAYEINVVLIRKDGGSVALHLTSAIVHCADMQPFGVVTLRANPELQTRKLPSTSLQVVAGCVEFLGLDPVKAAFGPRWEEMRNRLMLTAENILKRRLSDADVFSRTNDDGFSIWFKHGTEEENASRLARIGREIRVMLLGELGEDARCSVASYTQMTDVSDPSAPPSVVMEALTQRLAERRREAEQQAQELLDSVMRDQPRELTPICDKSGQATQSAFIDLPRALQGRFAGAMSLVGGADADMDTELLRIGLVAQAVLEDVAQGRTCTYFINLPAMMFVNRRTCDRVVKHLRSFGPAVGPRLCIVLSGQSADINRMRLAEAARMLQSMTKDVGVLLEQIELLPFDSRFCPFSVIGLSSEFVGDVADAKLRGFLLQMRQVQARVLIRLNKGESPRRWQALGADLTTIA